MKNRGDYCFAVEKPAFPFLFLKGRSIKIEGWFLGHNGQKAEGIWVQLKNQIYIANCIRREDVREKFLESGRNVDSNCGFEVEIELSRGIKYLVLSADIGSGKRIDIARFVVFVSRKAKECESKKIINNLEPIEDWYPYGATLEPRWGYSKSPHSILLNILESGSETYLKFLLECKTFLPDLLSIETTPRTQTDPFWMNGWFDSLDALALYGMVALKKPKVFLEIGSGHSTQFAYLAKKRYSQSTKIFSIDPAPRSEIDRLCDEVYPLPLQQMGLLVFERLEAGDILFFDGSHRLLQASDVTVFFLEVLPIIKPGVLIHLHDIFLPFDYPPQWAKRFYSEAYVLAVLFAFAAEKFEILFPSAFVATKPKLTTIFNELWQKYESDGLQPHGGSFWFMKKI